MIIVAVFTFYNDCKDTFLFSLYQAFIKCF